MAATAQQEVESLDRVLTRLATTEEANLEKVRTQNTHPKLPARLCTCDPSARSFFSTIIRCYNTDLWLRLSAGVEQATASRAWATEVSS